VVKTFIYSPDIYTVVPVKADMSVAATGVAEAARNTPSMNAQKGIGPTAAISKQSTNSL